MKLDHSESRRRLADSRHGVLATMHPDRGVDQVPVVFVVGTTDIFIPIDTVKAKTTTRLRRLTNIDLDPRCSLLVEGWSEDWESLWWVRASCRAVVMNSEESKDWHLQLSTRYPQYSDPGSIDGGMRLTPTELIGWAASPTA